MEPVKLQPGVYVESKDLTAEQRKAVADAYIAAGAVAGPCYPYRAFEPSYLGWDKLDNLTFGAGELFGDEFNLLLTYEQLMLAATPWVNDWATWRAIDENGEIWEYSDRPLSCTGYWSDASRTKIDFIKETPGPCKNWRDTLEEREAECECEAMECEGTTYQVVEASTGEDSEKVIITVTSAGGIANQNNPAIIRAQLLEKIAAKKNIKKEIRDLKKRLIEAEVYEMMQHAPDIDGGECCDDYNRRFAQALIKAGYRK